jgi:hypothetical protein
MMLISPLASGTKPISDLNSVDLPLPLMPTSAVIEPFGAQRRWRHQAPCCRCGRSPRRHARRDRRRACDGGVDAEPCLRMREPAVHLGGRGHCRQSVDDGLRCHLEQVEIGRHRSVRRRQRIHVEHAAIGRCRFRAPPVRPAFGETVLSEKITGISLSRIRSMIRRTCCGEPWLSALIAQIEASLRPKSPPDRRRRPRWRPASGGLPAAPRWRPDRRESGGDLGLVARAIRGIGVLIVRIGFRQRAHDVVDIDHRIARRHPGMRVGPALIGAFGNGDRFDAIRQDVGFHVAEIFQIALEPGLKPETVPQHDIGAKPALDVTRVWAGTYGSLRPRG